MDVLVAFIINNNDTTCYLLPQLAIICMLTCSYYIATTFRMYIPRPSPLLHLATYQKSAFRLITSQLQQRGLLPSLVRAGQIFS